MDDLDRLLAETMRTAAGHAPSDDGLLSTVHERSRRHQRRRVVTGLSAAAAVLVVGIPFAAVLATRPDPGLPPADPAPGVSAPPSPTAAASPSASPPVSASPSRTPSAPASPSGGTPAAGAVTLTGGWTAPAFPYTLPATDGMSDPVASMDGGNLIAFFEATDVRDHADVTVTVSGRKPSFTTPAAETAMPVRGRAGTLRTVDVRPAKQLTLVWQESPSRWIQVATDDTYPPEQVVSLADSLTGASIAVLPPFTLDLSPAGLVTDTVTASRMTFRPQSSAPGSGGLSTVLRTRRQLTGINQKISGYDAALTRQGDSVTLAVDVPDWDATLEVTVGGGLTISDADLIRYATGVHILNRSDPE